MNRAQPLHKPLELVKLSAEYLAEKGVQNARLDAEHLLAHVLGINRLQLYVDHERPIVPSELDRYRELIRRRGHREPLQLLVGDVQLLDRVFSVRPGVFIPRPETETLIRRAQELPLAGAAPDHIVEIGVGNGCIGVSLLAEWPSCRLTGYDISRDALELTEINAQAYDVADRISLHEEDGFEASLPECDLLISNPPYLADGELAGLEPEVREHDPREALVCGDDALAAIKKLVEQGNKCLAPGGWLLFEHGMGQESAVRELLTGAGYSELRSTEDLTGTPRVCEGRR